MHEDHQSVQEKLVPQIVILLTGLRVDQLMPSGVIFRDPATDDEIPLSAALFELTHGKQTKPSW